MRETRQHTDHLVARRRRHLCEPLEQRRLLAGEPVLVLVEQVLRIQNPDTVARVEPWVLNTTAEVEWNLSQYAASPPPWQGPSDADGNGYAGDAYGWNFLTNSPNFLTDIDDQMGHNGHGRAVTESAVGVFDYAEKEEIIALGDVKIMYVVTNSFTNGSAALNYILDKKQNRGVNIVAVGTLPHRTDRAGALALANAGIMLIGGEGTDIGQADTGLITDDVNDVLIDA